MKQSSLNEQEQMIMEMESRQQNLIKQTSMSDPERMILDMESKEEDAEEEASDDYRSATNGNDTMASTSTADNGANNDGEKGSSDVYKSIRSFLHNKYSDQQPEPPKPDGKRDCENWELPLQLLCFILNLKLKLLMGFGHFILCYSFAIAMGTESTSKGYWSILIRFT